MSKDKFKEEEKRITAELMKKSKEQLIELYLQVKFERDYLQAQYEGAIVPKFNIGQEVFVFDWSGQLRSGRVYEIQTNSVLHDKQPVIIYLVDFYGSYSDDDLENDYYEEEKVYATKEEAETKLKELKDDDINGNVY